MEAGTTAPQPWARSPPVVALLDLPRPSSSRKKDKPPQPAQSRRDCTAPSWLCCCNPARVPWSFLLHASVRLSWAESEPVQHQKWRLGTPLHVSKLGEWCALRVPHSPCDDQLLAWPFPAPLLIHCPAAPSRPSQDRSSHWMDGCRRGRAQSPAPK